MALVWVDRMAVDARGNGDVVLLVHGLGGSLNVWTPLLTALEGFRCVRPELPGAARSHRAYALGDTAPHKGQLSVATHVAALLRVCESLGVTRAHVVGHSFGTIIAQHLAVEAPGLVRSLVLMGAMAEPLAAARDMLRTRAGTARQQGLDQIAEGNSEFSLSASTRQTLPVATAFVRECVGAQDPEGYARNCEALAEARGAPADRIACPTLVINGDEDGVTPLQGARQLTERLPQARLEVLSRCGHWPMLERAAECQRALRPFLQSVRG